MDTLLVDRFGEVIITNDGITILTKMDVNHPAAKMVINTARAQENEIGDGTTTATIMAGALLAEGVNQALKGVPVTRIIEGVKLGINRAIEYIRSRSRAVSGIEDPILRQVALVAGREHHDIAELVVEAARLVGEEKLKEPGFKLADTVTSEEGADNMVFSGVIVRRERLNAEQPLEVQNARILVVDDALDAEQVGEEALSTEMGFKRYMELQEEFKQNLAKVVSMAVRAVFVDGTVHQYADEILTDAGVMVVSRVSSKELRKVAEFTAARAIKRTGLRKDIAELSKCLGFAEKVYEDEKLGHVRVLGGRGKPAATILVGAATEEVVDERERIAKDAASAVQAAVRGGVVPGGGSIELATAMELDRMKAGIKGMTAYGVHCVAEALKKPLAQIVANAGFNPLEKVGDCMAAQAESGKDSLAINCDTGEVVDMVEYGVLDPTLVKTYALKAAGEIAEAILRIDTIIKKKDEDSAPRPAQTQEMEF